MAVGIALTLSCVALMLSVCGFFVSIGAVSRVGRLRKEILENVQQLATAVLLLKKTEDEKTGKIIEAIEMLQERVTPLQ